MSESISAASLLRSRGANAHVRVTYVELFFDLIFVFAVTQLSHLLIGHLSLAGAFQTLLLLLAVWWAWIDTSWVTNWLEPNHPAVRGLLFVLMFLGLLLSASIPHAFDAEGLLFAITYACMQIGRSVFMLWVLRHRDPANFRNFQRIATWHLLIGVLWIGGALTEVPLRTAVWTFAVVLECVAPSVGFWVAGLGRSSTADWKVDGTHMAERCALFIIIALGESILVTGTTAAGVKATFEVNTAFTAAFLSTVAMWWIYFNIGAERGSRRIASDADPGRIARATYTYAHVIIVAGIVVTAVGDEIVLKHADANVHMLEAAVLIGGPALYLLGNSFFKRASAQYFPLSHLVGLGSLAVIAVASPLMTLLLLGAATTVVLIVVAAWETASLRSTQRLLQ